MLVNNLIRAKILVPLLVLCSLTDPAAKACSFSHAHLKFTTIEYFELIRKQSEYVGLIEVIEKIQIDSLTNHYQFVELSTLHGNPLYSTPLRFQIADGKCGRGYPVEIGQTYLLLESSENFAIPIKKKVDTYFNLNEKRFLFPIKFELFSK